MLPGGVLGPRPVTTVCQGELPGGGPARPERAEGWSPGGGGARRGRARPPARPPALPFLPSLSLASFSSLPGLSLPFPPRRALSEGGWGRSRPAHEEAAGSREGRSAAAAAPEPVGMSPLFGWVAKVSPGVAGVRPESREGLGAGTAGKLENGVKSEAPVVLRGCRGGKGASEKCWCAALVGAPGTSNSAPAACVRLFAKFFLAYVEFIEGGRVVYDVRLT